MRINRNALVMVALAMVLGAAAGFPALSASGEERAQVASRKATCPFIGSIVAGGDLPLYGSLSQPLAKVEDVERLGSTGKRSSLGTVLAVFATGNHAYTARDDEDPKLDRETPLGYFSLDFPGSQGSHPGHSGILQSDFAKRNSGRFDAEAWGRLESLANDDGLIKRSDIGKFIAHNLARDPQSRIASKKVLLDLASEAKDLIQSLYRAAKDLHKGATESKRKTLIALTKTLGHENLVGSSGEFGLLCALLDKSPKTGRVDGEFAVSLDDLRQMFTEYKLPAGWKEWKKSAFIWSFHSSRLAFSAAKELISIRKEQDE